MGIHNETWMSRYMDIAKLVATWSKDPRRKVGSVIVGKKGEIISQGYNGFPRGVEDLPERYEDRSVKHQFVVHSEINSIINASRHGTSVEGTTMYLYGLPPCCDCTKAIIQSGIKSIVIQIDQTEEPSQLWLDSFEVSKQMLEESNVEYTLII